MLFDYRLDVESHLNRIVKLVKSPDSKKVLELNLISKKVSKTIKRYLKDYSFRIHPQKTVLLSQIKTEFDILRNENDVTKINNVLRIILPLYEQYNSIPATYLLRHPEKFDAEHIGPESTGERSLTNYGVKQAKEFADSLVDEMLITNKPVELIINFSYYKRTRLFAEIIKLKTDWMRNNYGKNVKVVFSADNRISGDQVKTNGAKLDDWVKTKNASDASALVEDWFSGKVALPQMYTIYVGVTHLPNVVAFLVYYLHLGAGKAIQFKYADYLKFENAHFYYDKKWH